MGMVVRRLLHTNSRCGNVLFPLPSNLSRSQLHIKDPSIDEYSEWLIKWNSIYRCFTTLKTQGEMSNT